MFPPGQRSISLHELALTERYPDGLEHYQGLAQPSPQDDRMAGACLCNLRRLQEAKELLLRAQARGCCAAGIELATVYRFLGQPKLAAAVLEQVPQAELDAFDRALWLRERGAVHFADGELGQAAEALELAWGVAHRSSDTGALLASIGHLLGLVCGALGLDARAAHYLGEALRRAHPGRAGHIRLTWALHLSYLGRFEQAEQELRLARPELEARPGSAPVLEYVAGVCHRMQGRWGPALFAFHEAARLARQAEEAETEFYALLGACTAQLGLRDYAGARASLARAQPLAANAKMRASYLLRSGALKVQMDAPDGPEDLQRALQAFEALGLQREAGWAWLHLAEAHLRAGEEARALEALAKATDVRHSLGSGSPLVLELRLLPRAALLVGSRADDPYLKSLCADAAGAGLEAPTQVELRTLGHAELRVNGAPARPKYRHALEVLCFLLDRPGARLGEILASLFPDTPHARARNYFHQVRYDLEKALPGLRIPHDAGRYRVEWRGAVLSWDYAELRRAIATKDARRFAHALARYGGPFLPAAESEWAQGLRAECELAVSAFGRQLIAELHRAGRDAECLEVANRLAQLDPFDELVNEMRVRSCHAVGGRDQAARLIGGICRLYQQEVGEVPQGLASLRRELQG